MWQRNAFELWCWRRLFKVPWTARKSNQSILRETNPEYSSKGLLSKLKLQYFGHQTCTADLLEKTLMLGKTEGRRRGYQRMRRLYGITDAMGMNLGKLWEMVRDREAWRAAVHGVTKNWAHLGSWTTTWQRSSSREVEKGKKEKKKYHEFLSNLKKKNCGKVSLTDEMSSLHINDIVITELLGGKEFLLLLAKIKIITDG